MFIVNNNKSTLNNHLIAPDRFFNLKFYLRF